MHRLSPRTHVRSPLGFAAAVLASALFLHGCCGSSGGGGSVDPPVDSTPGVGAVYLADQDEDGLIELYLAPIQSAAAEGDGGSIGESIKLSQQLNSDGAVDGFAYAIDGSFVVYRARVGAADPFQLFLVDVTQATPAAAVRLDADDPTGEVQGFAIAPDMGSIVYSQGTETTGGVFLVRVGETGPEAPIRLDLTTGEGEGGQGAVGQLGFAPNASSLAFLQDEGALRSLFYVDLTGADPGAPQRLNGFEEGNASVLRFFYAPDVGSLAFLQAAGDLANGFVVDLSAPTPGPALQFNLDLLPQTSATPLAFSGNGQRLAFLSVASEGTTNVQMIDLVLGGAEAVAISVPVQINPPLPDGATVTRFEFAPDGTRVAYVADQEVVGRDELYVVELDVAIEGTSAPVKLNTQLPPGGLVNGQFLFSPDSFRVVYRAEQDINNQAELYLVNLLDLASGPTQLNGPLPVGGNVRRPILFTGDGTRVIYRADQDQLGTQELWIADATGAGTPTRTKLNAPLVPGGEVTQWYALSPAGESLLYLADQDTEEDYELYLVRNLELAGQAPSAPEKVNGALVPGGDVTNRFSIRP